MKTTDPSRESGYRGALPPRGDRLARPWVLVVIGAFILILVLSFLGIPSRFIPEPTLPLPSLPASPSVEPSVSPSGTPSAEGSASASASASAAPVPSPTATAE